MNEETKDLITKVLLWGGGALLVFMGLKVIWGMVWGILSLPLWVPLLIGGGGYYAYRRLKGRKENKDRLEGHNKFKLHD